MNQAPSPDVRNKAGEVIELYGREVPVANLIRKVWQLTLSDEYVLRVSSKLKGIYEATDRDEQLSHLETEVNDIFRAKETARFDAITMYQHILPIEELAARDQKYITESTRLSQKCLDELI
jgi:hypothetical protein